MQQRNWILSQKNRLCSMSQSVERGWKRSGKNWKRTEDIHSRNCCREAARMGAFPEGLPPAIQDILDRQGTLRKNHRSTGTGVVCALEDFHENILTIPECGHKVHRHIQLHFDSGRHTIFHSMIHFPHGSYACRIWVPARRW